MRLNSRLILVGVLIFVFPLLFVWVTQSFFTTAYDNINSAQKQKVGMLHDSVKVIWRESTAAEKLLPLLATSYQQENSDITKIKLVEVTPDGLLIEYSLDEQEVGTYVTADALFRNLPLAAAEAAYIYPATINGVRTWQVFSSLQKQGNSYIIFSEHTFQVIDGVMLARQQQSYLGLTGIFLFLIVLAYWLNRQAQWERRHNKLSQQLAERDLFSSMIAHEFRTPLTAIKGYAGFLQESATLNDEDKRFASNIKLAAERLVLLVNDFLEVARLQSGKMHIKQESVQINELLQKVVDDLQMTAEEKNLKLTFEKPTETLLLSSDRARLGQVMTNLLSNALKYTPAGTITIACKKSAHKLEIRIKDTGTGISAEDQQRLFTPFERVGDVSNSAITGSGLGMWITKQLVQQLGGDIGVESIKGVGTHVVVTLHQ